MQTNNETPPIIRLDETDSTNRYMRRLLAEKALSEGCVIIADYQTAGKGQTGNSWEAERGANLLFSLLLRPDFLPADRQFVISQITSLSVKETLEAYTDSISVKWPNDVYWKDRKICGMLIENDLAGTLLDASIIGIGLNVNQLSFRSDAPNPVSLAQITGRRHDRAEVLERFLRLFFSYYCRLLQGKETSIQSAYRKALYHGDGYYRYADTSGLFEACIESVEPTGHLLLHLRNGETRRYAFKEVTTIIGS